MKPVISVLIFFIVLTLHSIGAAQTAQKKALTLGGSEKSNRRGGCRSQK